MVGEGTTDWAFLKYIKSLYIIRGCGVSAKVLNARGKGPDHVVDYAIRQRQNAAYDRIIALLDSDLEISTGGTQAGQVKKDTNYKGKALYRGSVA